MIAAMTQRLIDDLRSNQVPREIPKVLDNIIRAETNKLRIFSANLQYSNDLKFKNISADAHNWDIIFLIEPWRNLKEINGFDKYIYPNKYYNTLYIRKDIQVQIDLNGFGLTVAFKDKVINFMYIPPDNKHVQ